MEDTSYILSAAHFNELYESKKKKKKTRKEVNTGVGKHLLCCHTKAIKVRILEGFRGKAGKVFYLWRLNFAISQNT